MTGKGPAAGGMAEEVKETASTATSGVHFVLIHGVCHGSWCWYKVRCLMESSGHRVTCIDLKGAGIDPADANAIVSFDEYNQPLIDFLLALPDDEKVVLVGHSAGGLSVTHATHKLPHKIQLSVFIGATMLKWGYQTQQDIKDGIPDLSEYGEVYDYGYGLGVDQPPTSFIFKKEFLPKIVYQLSPLEDCTLAAMLLRPASLRALYAAKFTKESDEWDKVQRVYIKTLQDKVMKPEQQDAMISKWPPFQVYTIDTDHFPSFSSPSLLSALLVEAVTLAKSLVN
ncbi:hypothetical protein Ancab_034607 [Ancistrocladus abbreviatus]